MNKTSVNRPQIAIYGACNVGKSTLLNSLTHSDAAIVSPHSGTTTDSVRKIFEIIDFSPVVFIDTAGLDDDSLLGDLRVKRTLEMLDQTDMAILLFRHWGDCEQRFCDLLQAESIPFVALRNRVAGDPVNGVSDVRPTDVPDGVALLEIDALNCDEDSRQELFSTIKAMLPEHSYRAAKMFSGRSVSAGETVLLVCPIDSQAPAGRLILPQVQAIRELLDMHAVVITVQPAQIEGVLAKGIKPSLVVTDSQVYSSVRQGVPPDIEVTSFSILLAAAKGDMELYEQGLKAIDTLKEGSKVLISESCSHQVGCEDIGRVKIPRWLEEYCGCKLRFTFITGGGSLPEDLHTYSLMVQCGGCMVTRRALLSRLRRASAAGVAVTNYGMLIRKCR